MNKKLSTGFAIAVIILIGSFLASIIKIKSENNEVGSLAFYGSNHQKNKTVKCEKHAYEGEAKVQAWYTNSENDWILNISDKDFKKLPNGSETKTAKLVDGSPDVVKKLKNASKDNPAEITIKGFYFECGKTPLVSFAPGGEVFKKYLK